MKVAEKDNVVQGMLEDEYRRSQEVVKALHAKVENYPKGALNVRRKKGKGKEYVYHYLVRRDGKKVINQHIAERDLAELQKRLEERDKYQKEILAYKKRMVYLERLLKEPNREVVMKNQLPDNLFPERIKDLLHAISGVGFFERSVVIGSWVMLIYQELYGARYVLRTLDVDFAVHIAHTKSKLRADLKQLITGLGFADYLAAEGVQTPVAVTRWSSSGSAPAVEIRVSCQSPNGMSPPSPFPSSTS